MAICFRAVQRTRWRKHTTAEEESKQRVRPALAFHRRSDARREKLDLADLQCYCRNPLELQKRQIAAASWTREARSPSSTISVIITELAASADSFRDVHMLDWMERNIVSFSKFGGQPINAQCQEVALLPWPSLEAFKLVDLVVHATNQRNLNLGSFSAE